MKIYFDEVLIDENGYAGLTKSGEVYSESFKLGATICETYKLTLDKMFVENPNPQIVKLYDENDEITKTLYVDSIEEDDFTITYSLVDGMIKFNFAYDASLIIGEDGATLLDVFKNICELAGIVTDITEFYGSDIVVTWYDNTYMARDYIGYIGELNGSNLKMSADNKLVFDKVNKEPAKVLTFDDIADYKIGTKHIISRVVWDNGANKWEFGDETGETYYINTQNVYVLDENAVENIYNSIKGFTYYNFQSSNIIFDGLSLGDIVVFKDGEVQYPTFVQFSELNFMGGKWFGGIELNVLNEQQEETQVIGDKERIRAIKIIVDRNSNQIIQVVEETQEISTKVDNNTTDINNNYQEIIQKFGDLVTDDELIQLKESMQTQLDATKLEISNIKTVVVDGVEYVKNTSGTFDDNGLTMEQTGAKTKTVLNQDGVDVKDTQGSGNEDLLFAGYVSSEKAKENEELAPYEGQTIVYTKNIIVRNYLTIGTKSRIEDYEDGTGIFYLG